MRKKKAVYSNPIVEGFAKQDLNTVFEEGMEQSKISIMATDLGPGVRAIVALPDTGRMGPLFLFTEAYLPKTPRNDRLGWSSDEIITASGVVVPSEGTRTRMVDGVESPVVLETITIDEFGKKYLKSDLARLRLDRLMENMEEVTLIGDEFFQQMNQAWHSREPDTNSLGGPRYLI